MPAEDLSVMIGGQEVKLPKSEKGKENAEPGFSKNKTPEQATVEFLEAATSRMKLDHTKLIPELTKAILGQPTTPAPQATPQEQPFTKEIAQMITSMAQMYQSIATTEREARIAAEAAKDTATAARWDEVAKQTAETKKRLEEAQANPAGSKDPIDIYREYRKLLDEEMEKLPKPVPPPPPVISGPSNSEIGYRTKRLELSYNAFLDQQKQIIENQNRAFDFEKYKYDKDHEEKMATIAEKKARQDSLINTLTGFLDNLGKNPSVQGFLSGLGKKENPGASVASPNVTDVTATITKFPCQSCGTPIDIEPEATAVACSKCGAIYEITKTKKG